MHQYMAQRVTYARPLSRAASVRAAAHVGIRRFMKYNTLSTNEINQKIIREIVYFSVFRLQAPNKESLQAYKH